MSTQPNSYLVPAMVYVGAVGLIGLPVAGVSLSVLGDVQSVLAGTSPFAGESWFGDGAFLAAYCLSILIGLQLAVEAAALQLGGLDALGRGPRWAVLGRHLGLSLAAVVVLAWVTTVGASAVTGSTNPVLVLAGGVLVLASLAITVVGLSNFRAGYTGSVGADKRGG